LGVGRPSWANVQRFGCHGNRFAVHLTTCASVAGDRSGPRAVIHYVVPSLAALACGTQGTGPPLVGWPGGNRAGIGYH
jgi:hypothetical protein